MGANTTPGEDMPRDMWRELPMLDPGEYAGVDPVAGLGAPTRVGDLEHHVEHMRWLRSVGKLELSVSLGGRNVDTPAYPFEEGLVAHPWSTQWVDPVDGSAEVVRRYFGTNQEGNNWCRTLGEREDEVFCFHRLKKAGESVRWWTSGDGVETPIEWARLPEAVNGSGGAVRYRGKNVRDVVERADGTVYFSADEKGNKITVFRAPADRTAPPVAILQATGEQYDLINHLALSVDEAYLFFTTVGYKHGASHVWFAKIAEDGSLETPQKFVDEVIPRAWGLTFDAAGNLYVASGKQVRVFASDGTPWGIIPSMLPEELATDRHAPGVTALAFGGEQGDVLYVAYGMNRLVGFSNHGWPNRGAFNKARVYALTAAIPGAWRR